MGESGLAGASVRRISDVAGVTTGTFYNHFASADALIEEIANELTLGVQIEQGALASIENDPQIRVLVGVRQLLQLTETDPEMAQAFVTLLPLVPSFRFRVRTLIMRTIADGIAAGRFYENDPWISADALLGATVQWMRSRLVGDLTTEITLEQMRLAQLISGAKRPTSLGPVRRAIELTTASA